MLANNSITFTVTIFNNYPAKPRGISSPDRSSWLNQGIFRKIVIIIIIIIIVVVIIIIIIIIITIIVN